MAKKDLLEGLKVIVHDSFVDNRGQLYTLWNKEEISYLDFNHDKVAVSKKNVLRGLHTDKSWKLITCLHGEIQLVVVNFDKSSKEYLDYSSFILNSYNSDITSVLVPPGYLNGHLVLSDEAIFHYKWCYDGEYPDVSDQVTVNCFDPKIGINWVITNPIQSERDQKVPLL